MDVLSETNKPKNIRYVNNKQHMHILQSAEKKPFEPHNEVSKNALKCRTSATSCYSDRFQL